MTTKRKIELLENEVKRLRAENENLSKHNSDAIDKLVNEYKQKELERLAELHELQERYDILIEEMKCVKNGGANNVWRF